MTDEQLDEIDQAMSDGAVTWYQLERLTAETRRLRELERACRMARIIPGGLKGHYYAHEQAGLDTIGRLLEGEG